MKKVVGLLLILAVLLLGGYYGMGVVTEKTLTKNIAVINKSRELSLELKEYHRGWFKSNALLNWTLHLPERKITDTAGLVTTTPAQDYTIQLPLNIYHGPIMLADNQMLFGLGYASSDIALPQMYLDEFKRKFTDESTPPLLKMTMYVNFVNNSTLKLSLPSFKLISKEGNSQFEWQGMMSDVNLSSNLDNFRGHVTITGFNFSKGKANAVLENASSDYDLHRTSLGLYTGDANLFVPSLVVTQDTKTSLEVKSLDLHTSSQVNNGLFDSHFKTTADRIAVEGRVHGPVLIEFSVNNLDASVLAKINEQANMMQQGSDAQKHEAMLLMLPELPKLLSKGAQFNLSELSIGMPEGVIKGNLLVSLPNADAGNPFQLIQKVQGEGKLEIPEVVLKHLLNDSIKQMLQNQATVKEITVEATTPAEATKVPSASVASDKAIAPLPTVDVEQQSIAQTDARLAALVTSGVLSLNGTNYVIELKLSQGQLLVNGKPFNSGMLQF